MAPEPFLEIAQIEMYPGHVTGPPAQDSRTVRRVHRNVRQAGRPSDNAVQPDSCINMMYFMYLWLPFIFDIIITVILSFLNVESANMKLKENMQNQ